VSHKSGKIAALLEGVETGGWDPHYAGYFVCFNRGQYYEAHDVLEELWLAGGKAGANYAFYKGLIQLAGAFVHLQKQRLGPAVALFNLAETNLSGYPATHDGIEVTAVLHLLTAWRSAVRVGEPDGNPLPQRPAPQLASPRPLPLG
jgi:hypothetical protein